MSPQDGLLPLDQWSHIVGTYTDTNEVIWINGVKRDSQNQTNLPIPQKQGVLTLGCASDGEGPIYLGLSGALDEVAIYDEVLTDAQITNHYNLGKPTRDARGCKACSGSSREARSGRNCEACSGSGVCDLPLSAPAPMLRVLWRRRCTCSP